MFRKLQPVSDLQRAQRFDDFDLTANRAGMFSHRQRWRYVGARLGDHLLGALVVAFAAGLIVDLAVRFLGYRADPTAMAVAGAIILIAALVLFAIRVRAAFRPAVKSVSGQVAKHEVVPLDGVPLEEVLIGSATFFVRPEVLDILDEDMIYKVYYLERSPRAGGNLLLSTEALGTAPAGD